MEDSIHDALNAQSSLLPQRKEQLCITSYKWWYTWSCPTPPDGRISPMVHQKVSMVTPTHRGIMHLNQHSQQGKCLILQTKEKRTNTVIQCGMCCCLWQKSLGVHSPCLQYHKDCFSCVSTFAGNIRTHCYTVSDRDQTGYLNGKTSCLRSLQPINCLHASGYLLACSLGLVPQCYRYLVVIALLWLPIVYIHTSGGQW